MTGLKKVERRMVNRMNNSFPEPKARVPKRYSHAKKNSAKHIPQAQKNLARFLEDVGYKVPGGPIKTKYLNRIAVADEVDGKTKLRPKRVRSFKSKSKLQPIQSTAPELPHTTLLPTVFLDGQSLPPLVVCPQKKEVPEYLIKAINEEWKHAPFGCNPSGSGFIIGDLFYGTYLYYRNRNHIVPIPTKQEPFIVILDGHKTRYKDSEKIIELRNLNVIFWVTPPNSTWRVSLLDQTPFRQYHNVLKQQLEIIMDSQLKSVPNLEMKTRAMLRAWKICVDPARGYIASGARMSGLHPFIEELDGLQIGDTLGVDVNAVAVSSGLIGKKRKRTVHDVHRCGGRLDSAEILDILKESAAKKKKKESKSVEFVITRELNMDKMSKSEKKNGYSIDQLQNECERHGLVKSGTKQIMAQRLLSHYIEHMK